MSSSRAFALLTLVFAALVAQPLVGAGVPRARAADAPAPAAAELVFHADLDGRLAEPACGRAETPPPDYAHLVAALTAAQEAARARAAAPIAILGPNVVGPGLFARGVLKWERGGAERLAAVLARARYAAVGIGHHDLALDPERYDRFAGALAAAGMPLVATNLRCDPARRGFCRAVRDHVVVERGGARVAILGVISPLVWPGIAPANRQGLAIEPPEAAVRAAVRRLRGRGIERIALMVAPPRSNAGFEEVVALQARLGADAPDVLLSASLARGAGAIRVVRQDGTPPLVGSSEGSASAARIALPSGGEAAIAVEVLRAARDADPETAAALAPLVAGHCARYGAPVAPADLRAALSREAFTAYLLAVMRKEAGAEIALVNRSFVKAAPFPLRGRLRREDLLRALPYEATVGTARVTGAALGALLGPALGNPRLAALGAERGPGPLLVNGRPIDPTRHYRVATIEFVARGGDELFADGTLPFRPLPGAPELRAAIERFLATRTADEDGDPTVDPTTDFGPPASARPLLVATGDLSLDLASTSLRRHPAYTAPQLTRAEQRSVKGDLLGQLQLRSPVHEGDARLKLLYGYARQQPATGPAVSGETADLVTLSTIYNFRGLRGWEGPIPRPAVPDPYVRLLLESELTRPAVTPMQPRAFRHAELTATAGALFPLHPKLRVRGGPGLRTQLLADGDAGRVRPLFEAGAALDPIALATFGPLSARLEGLVDYVFLDPASTREHQVRASAKVSLPLLPLLFVTAGVDAFAVQQRRLGWGIAYDTTVGLRLRVDAVRQAL